MREAYCCGYECLVSWADLLDRINVYPVADADTGTNLRTSLVHFRDISMDKTLLIHRLACFATGNSGNIAASFLVKFVQACSFAELAETAAAGRKNAWQSIIQPKPGTMLTVFDRLAEILADESITRESAAAAVRHHLQKAVISTSRLLPDLERAGVVDSGALGIFIFFDGFFQKMARKQSIFCPVTHLFKDRLAISDSFQAARTGRFCVDALIDPHSSSKECRWEAGSLKNTRQKLAELGESVVVVPDKSSLKIHIHTPDPEALRRNLALFASIVEWQDSDIDAARPTDTSSRQGRQAVHVVTDAAGSLSRETAENLGITLLDSYIVTKEESRPESLFSHSQIYQRLRKGERITTAQASVFERCQHYQSLVKQFTNVLYLCVGAAYTNNYAVVTAWKKEFDPDNRLKVLDSGAACGRLAAAAISTARYARETDSPAAVLEFARGAVELSEEYIFIDKLKYLAAGGRLARPSGFIGDLLRMKPVISPTRAGAEKIAVVKNRAAQLQFALGRLGEKMRHDSTCLIILQYSDNEELVKGLIRAEIERHYPQAEILVTPLSLTSGVHMGPGTWGAAFL
ncbi:DegV family protein [Desulfobacterota bacterium M19]